MAKRSPKNFLYQAMEVAIKQNPHLSPEDALAHTGGVFRSREKAGLDPYKVPKVEPAPNAKKFDAIRSHEGHGGTSTPKEGDRVRIAPGLQGGGKFGVVTMTSPSGSFHDVSVGGKHIGAYHSSDLKTKGKKFDSVRWSSSDPNRQSEDPDAPQYSSSKYEHHGVGGETQFTNRAASGSPSGGGGGSKGRGNWGHKGRKGIRGGSA